MGLVSTNVWMLGIAAAAALSVFACSSSSSGGGGGSCPAAGYKACPNDTPLSQQLADACSKSCSSEYSALVGCDSNALRGSCDSQGMSKAAPAR